METAKPEPQFLDLIETLSQFDSKILEVIKVVESTYQVFDELKKEWNFAAFELRESLAKSTHLRRKDFDFIVQGVFDFQDKREKEVRTNLYHYLDNQKEFSQSLKKLLIQVEKHKENQDVEDIQNETCIFVKLKEEFEIKEKIFKESIGQFKKEQEFIAEALQNFLKIQNITVKSFKETISNLLKSLVHEEKISDDKKEGEKEESLIKAA